MVIADFRFVGVSLFPDEAQPVFVVDADRMLAWPVLTESFQGTADPFEVVQGFCGMQLEQLPHRHPFDALEFTDPVALE
jgi:hypothetical protein